MRSPNLTRSLNTRLPIIWRSNSGGGRGDRRFVEKYVAKYLKAAECLTKDRDVLLAFDDARARQSAAYRTKG